MLMELKEWNAHAVFELRMAKQTEVYYQNNKPNEVYIVWGRW